MDNNLLLFLSLLLVSNVNCIDSRINVELLIIPSPKSKGLNTLFKRVEETLNLTCSVTSQETDSLPTYDLEWLLPFTPQNSQNRVSYVYGHNMLSLVVQNLKESDSGDYNCEAKLDDLFIRETVKINVKNKKSCNEQMFSCPSGPCIPRRFMCDGQQDCKSGADEAEVYCGIDPCAKKLNCEDGRCIPMNWCCDQYTDVNCTVKLKPPCCMQLSKRHHDDGHTSEQQRYSDMGFLQTTIYTVIGCAMAFMFIVTILVVAICRVHMKRTCTPGGIASVSTAHGIRCARLANNSNRFPNGGLGRGAPTHSLLVHHPHASLSSDPSATSTSHLHSLQLYDLDLYLNAATMPSGNGRENVQSPQTTNQNPHSLLVTYNINNGVQFVGRPVDPPPYCEVMSAPPREGPPPPYVSQEDISSAVPMSQTVTVPGVSASNSHSDAVSSPSPSSSPALLHRTAEETRQTEEEAVDSNREPQATDSLLGATLEEVSETHESND